MKVTRSLIGGIIGLAMLAMSAFAVDYSTMTTEELAKLRGKMQNVTVEERNAFQNEWQKRIQTMTQEDNQKYLGKPGIAGQGSMMQQKGSIGGGRGGRR
ncbi:MAG: DUF1104 domain-containing protein [Nitrospirae bacterium]|nr:DUF1104 domain-containing protein [Nitrospirota bacterium]